MTATIHVTRLVVDWPRLLDDLRRGGIRTGLIANATGLSSGNIREYRLGVKSPMHANGERLIAYWMLAMARERTELPMVEVL